MKRLLIVLLLAGAVRAEDVKLFGAWGFATDSIRWTHKADGVQQATGRWTDGRQTIDSTLTVVSGAYNIMHLRLYEQGYTAPKSYLFVFNRNQEPDAIETWITDSIYLGETADSISARFYAGTSLSSTTTLSSVSAYPQDTFSVSSAQLSEVEYLIYYPGDSAASMRLFYDLVTDTTGGSVTLPAKTCLVSVLVRGPNGAGVEGVEVVATLARHNVSDSAGGVVKNVSQRSKTNSSGIATFTCYWSSYLLPETKYVFQIPSFGIGVKSVTIPRQTTYTVDWSSGR